MTFVGFTAIPAVILTAIFLTSFILEPRRLINGVLFNLATISLLFFLAAAILNSGNRLLIAVSATLFVIGVGVIAVIFALHLVWLAWNAWLVWRRESHSLGNMLTLVLLAGILGLEIAATLSRDWLPAPLYNSLAVLVTFSIGYELIAFYNFLTILVLYNFYPVRHDKNYLIVLGAGLLDGERVSPLLAARIEAGIHFYRRQLALKNRPHPILLFSGGQGGDEKRAESVAMREYALAQGVPEADTRIEDESKTTYQNMKFSAALMAEWSGEQPFKAAFFTNNFHLFRAGVFARAAGLKANGVGAATSFYFLPNAVIREYAAFVVIHKKRHLVIIGLIALLALAIGLMTLI